MDNINLSPQLSAEMTGVQINNNIHLNVDFTKRWSSGELDKRRAFPANFIAQTRKALNPAKYEANLSEAHLIRAKSICKACELYRQTLLSLSDEQVFLLACGYITTPDEADNVMKILSSTAMNVDSDSDSDALSDEFKDEFIKGAESAYEDEVRNLWSKLLNSELTKPGTFSKHTLATLKDMSREDAETFQAFCSCTVFVHGEKEPVPVLTDIDDGGWTYNLESLSVDQLNNIVSLGLVNTSKNATFTIAAQAGLNVFSATDMYLLVNNSDGPKQISFGGAMFTPTGRELSLVCDVGSYSNIPVLIGKIASRYEMPCQSKPLSS